MDTISGMMKLNSTTTSSSSSSCIGGEVPPSPGWVRPADVMRVRKLRAKRHALQARMGTGPLMVRTQPRPGHQQQVQVDKERRNPFR